MSANKTAAAARLKLKVTRVTKYNIYCQYRLLHPLFVLAQTLRHLAYSNTINLSVRLTYWFILPVIAGKGGPNWTWRTRTEKLRYTINELRLESPSRPSTLRRPQLGRGAAHKYVASNLAFCSPPLSIVGYTFTNLTLTSANYFTISTTADHRPLRRPSESLKVFVKEVCAGGGRWG